ncbi:MAG: thioredoxin [Smithellaceae bacterium]|nr:thioredoxin [Smithellaceae bacterium]
MEVTDANFNREVISSPDPVLVDFWAPWCSPRRLVGPVIEELAAKYAGGIVFAKLNVDENPVVATQYNVSNIPTLIVFKEGKPVDRIVGAMPKEDIEQRLRTVMKMN